MSRRRVFLLFGLCAAAIVGVMAWLTATVHRLEDAERRSREEAILEESVRLSLWRMESVLVPLLAEENSRAHSVYRLRPDGPITSLIPPSPHIRLRFQWDAKDALSSPSLALRTKSSQPPKPTPRHEVESSLEALARLTDRKTLLAHLDSEWREVERPRPASESRGRAPSVRPSPQTMPPDRRAESAKTAESAPPSRQTETQKRLEPAQSDRVSVSPDKVQQLALNLREWQARTENVVTNIAPSEQIGIESKAQPIPSRPPAAEVRIGWLQPVWIGEELLLARRVRIGTSELVQGCWLDWIELRGALLAAVRDLLPEANLTPARVNETDQARRLAALPIRLIPGRSATTPLPDVSPLRLPLLVAWVCASLSVLSVGALLMGIATLSERRAAFVSAVTHELRTPLTTFRMYADMLAEGMVRDQAEQREYLATLQREAERQTHLVENVLAYSRLERGRYSAARTPESLGPLLAELVITLAAHAASSGMTVVTSADPECDALRVLVDRSAVERVLFNLVDNACKYAHGATDRRIHVDCRGAEKSVIIDVSDHGPGLSRKEARRLFQPFHKSARDAALSAPGVGLGLALSRRLARAIGGDLSLVQAGPEGARFRLRLPRAKEAWS